MLKRTMLLIIIIALLVFMMTVNEAKKKRKVQGPKGMSRRQSTSCNEFSKYARFNPYSVLNETWFVFFYWAAPRPLQSYRFFAPTETHKQGLYVLFDGKVTIPVNWTARLVLMQDRYNMTWLLVERGDRGQYWSYIVAKAAKNNLIEAQDIRLRQHDNGRLLGLMECKSEYVYIMSRIREVPPHSRIQEEAARFGYRARRGKSYLYRGHEWMPVPEADEDDFFETIIPEIASETNNPENITIKISEQSAESQETCNLKKHLSKHKPVDIYSIDSIQPEFNELSKEFESDKVRSQNAVSKKVRSEKSNSGNIREQKLDSNNERFQEVHPSKEIVENIDSDNVRLAKHIPGDTKSQNAGSNKVREENTDSDSIRGTIADLASRKSLEAVSDHERRGKLITDNERSQEIVSNKVRAENTDSDNIRRNEVDSENGRSQNIDSDKERIEDTYSNNIEGEKVVRDNKRSQETNEAKAENTGFDYKQRNKIYSSDGRSKEADSEKEKEEYIAYDNISQAKVFPDIDKSQGDAHKVRVENTDSGYIKGERVESDNDISFKADFNKLRAENTDFNNKRRREVDSSDERSKEADSEKEKEEYIASNNIRWQKGGQDNEKSEEGNFNTAPAENADSGYIKVEKVDSENERLKGNSDKLRTENTYSNSIKFTDSLDMSGIKIDSVAARSDEADSHNINIKNSNKVINSDNLKAAKSGFGNREVESQLSNEYKDPDSTKELTEQSPHIKIHHSSDLPEEPKPVSQFTISLNESQPGESFRKSTNDQSSLIATSSHREHEYESKHKNMFSIDKAHDINDDVTNSWNDIKTSTYTTILRPVENQIFIEQKSPKTQHKIKDPIASSGLLPEKCYKMEVVKDAEEITPAYVPPIFNEIELDEVES